MYTQKCQKVLRIKKNLAFLLCNINYCGFNFIALHSTKNVGERQYKLKQLLMAETQINPELEKPPDKVFSSELNFYPCLLF